MRSVAWLPVCGLLAGCIAQNPNEVRLFAVAESGEVRVQEQDPADEAPMKDHAQPLVTAPPGGNVELDWVRLTSGEWLGGALELIRDESLEFDSDKLGVVSLSLDDVAELHSPRVFTVMDERRRTYVGCLDIRDDLVVVSGDEEEVRLTRDDLLAAVPGEPRERNYWTGKLTFGMAARAGNTDQVDVTTYAYFRRRTAATRWATTYNGTFSRVNNVDTVENYRLESKWDVFLTKRLFVTPVGATFFRDPFQNIELRTAVMAGMGYEVVHTPTFDWNLAVGGGYQQTRLDSVEAGEDDTDGTVVSAVGTKNNWDLTSDVSLKFDYSLVIPVPDTHDYNHHMALILSAGLIGDFDLDVGFIWDRLGNPERDSSGNLPDKDDYRLNVGIGWSF